MKNKEDIFPFFKPQDAVRSFSKSNQDLVAQVIKLTNQYKANNPVPKVSLNMVILDELATYNHTAAWPFPTNEAQWPELPAKLNLDMRVAYILPNEMFPGNLGATIVYRKCSEFKNTRMVEVAVVYCSPNDTFTKRTGRKLALESFENGNTVKIPIRTTDADLPWRLKSFFAL